MSASDTSFARAATRFRYTEKPRAARENVESTGRDSDERE